MNPKLLLLLALTLTACNTHKHTPTTGATISCDDGSGAYYSVLSKLSPLLYPDLHADAALLTKYEERARCIRDWANSIGDPCIRKWYLLWVDSYTSQYSDMRDKLKNNKPTESTYERDEREREEEIAAFEKTHTVPKPPSCDLEVVKRVK